MLKSIPIFTNERMQEKTRILNGKKASAIVSLGMIRETRDLMRHVV